MKYIFVVGGVLSGVGKGITAASIGKILQARGLEVTAIKIDPYINVDAGTMNPTEHGEVFVLNDGMECDQDMGNYERFLNRNLSRANYMTTGSVYLHVIQKERNLEYGGKFVSVVPYIPLEVIERIKKAGKLAKADVVVVEIGGTAGEYENILFLEAVRMMKIKEPENVLVALVSLVPSLEAGGTELKTKPTQHAVRSLQAVGVHPDIIFARANVSIDEKRKEKIAFFCGMEVKDVIAAPNVDTIYRVPLNFEKEGLSDRILKKLNLKPKQRDLSDWKKMVGASTSSKTVKIGIVGKYFGSGSFVLTDSYISVLEAIKHASYFHNRKPIIEWLDSEQFEKSVASVKSLSKYDGVIIPGGFGSRGVEGKVAAIKYLREHKIPYFGLCYGMQLAVVEYARNVLKFKGAHTTEINPKTSYPVIDIMPEQKELMKEKKYGATMRLGAYPAVVKRGTVAYGAYATKSDLRSSISDLKVSERHRHRFEVNPDYIAPLEKAGLVFSGISPDRRLMEILELPRAKHPFFLGTQFHPELTSRPLAPQPLFREFIKAAAARSKK